MTRSCARNAACARYSSHLSDTLPFPLFSRQLFRVAAHRNRRTSQDAAPVTSHLRASCDNIHWSWRAIYPVVLPASRWLSLSCLPGAAGERRSSSVAVEASDFANATGLLATSYGYRLHGTIPMPFSSVCSNGLCSHASGQ